MATEDIILKVRLDEMRKELAKIPGITSKEINKMVATVGKGARDAGRETEKAAQGAKKLLGGLGFSGVANDVEDLVEGMGALGPAIGAGAVAAVTATVAIKAYVEVLEWLARWSLESALNVEKLADQSRNFPRLNPIDEDAIERSRKLNAEMEALNAAWAAAGVTIGSELGPELEQLGLIMVQGAIYAERFFEQYIEGQRNIVQLIKQLDSLAEKVLGFKGPGAAFSFSTAEAEKLTDAMAGQADLSKILKASHVDNSIAVDKFTDAQKALEAALRKTADTTASNREAIEDYRAAERRAHELERQRTDGLHDLASMMRDVGKATREQTEAAQHQVEVMAALKAMTEKAIGAGMAEVGDAAAEAWRDAARAAQTYLGALDSVMSTAAQFAELSQAAAGEDIEATRDRIAHARKLLDSKNENEANAARVYIRNQREMLRAEKERAREAFKVSQGIAIAQAVVNAASATLALIPGLALAMGPLAAGAPIAAAAISAVALAAEVATIKAQKPSFHVGYTPPEYDAKLARGEGVANNRAMAQPGFREALRTANAGQAPTAQPTEARLLLDGRDLRALDTRMARHRTGGGRSRAGSRTHYDGG